MMENERHIRIRGARVHNLQNVDVELPLGGITVVTGPSGSGKTSLAMHTLYAEGQRRYIETFSPYVRQFMDRMDRPDVDAVENILPAIALEQRNSVKNSRSTVGTMTAMNEYWKLIFSRIAVGHDENGRLVRPETPLSVATRLAEEYGSEADVLVCFSVPVVGTFDEMRQALMGQGYVRLRTKDGVSRLDEMQEDEAVTGLPEFDADGRWLVVQDRVHLQGNGDLQRLMEAVETAMRLGGDVVHVFPRTEDGWGAIESFRGDWFPLLEPRPGLFSGNSPLGACPECKGYGRMIVYDYLKGLRPELSIRQGAVKVFESERMQECREDLVRIGRRTKKVRVDVPWSELTEAEKEWVVEGEEHDIEKATAGDLWYGIKGFFIEMERYTHKMPIRVFLSHYRIYSECTACGGGRLRPEALRFTVGGKTVPEVLAMPMDELLGWIDVHIMPAADKDKALLQVARELRSRVAYLNEVGLGYITADRLTRTLSGGEIERVSLTTCLGAALTDTLFVLDEPTVGLHPRDTSRLISAMQRLRKRGNTLVVVEHEEAVMRAADYLVDMGPASGSGGGRVVYAGQPEGILSLEESATGHFLSGSRSIAVPKKRRKAKKQLSIRGAECHNLHGLDVDIPLGVYTCLTGVSGSGKSTLAREILYAHACAHFGTASEEAAGKVASVKGFEHVEEVVLVDQSPIVRTPRSTPAVYVGMFEEIRALFALEPAAKARGLTAGYFSFNSGDGRCPRCSGLGQEKVEMQFLSDIFVPCALCGGTRYREEALGLKWNGMNMSEVLALDIRSAREVFGRVKNARAVRVCRKLDILLSVGLGHLGLGQPLNTLSGGENQRLKLAKILVDTFGQESKKGKLLVLDEPGTGLHFSDLEVLLQVFYRMVESGHSLLVIEHNLELIKCADHVIDLGPEGGAGGGRIVAQGTPEQVAEAGAGFTGAYLRPMLGMESGDLLAAEPEAVDHEEDVPEGVIALRGARHHQLKNIDVDIPRGEMTVITGLSGSGKSTLAFDIVFAEGQRRFLDVMSPYARQFTEQLEVPDIDRLTGLPPTVAIEQNRSRGGTKSTVGTVTEVWQFMRLLYAKLGTPHCPSCKVPVGKRGEEELLAMVEQRLAQNGSLMLAAPVVRNRKGHYADLARWAEGKKYPYLRADGRLVKPSEFVPLDRYSNHDVDIVTALLGEGDDVRRAVAHALELGDGFVRLLAGKREELLGTKLACPCCGESFPEPEPSTFSFNSPRGWCPTCRGHGRISEARFDSDKANSELEAELRFDRDVERAAGKETSVRTCPDCRGLRLSPWALGVMLQGQGIADVGKLSAVEALDLVRSWSFDGRDGEIARNVVAEISQRLDFLQRVGLGYLSLDRSATTLSGGETQRIRLAAQLGSELRGVLYVLDEPTIGLHPRDNDRLLSTLDELKQRGNTLLVVEHDEETMKRADHLIDLGPGAGVHGGEVVAQGTFRELEALEDSVTGLALRDKPRHPYRGAWRGVKDVPFLEVKGCTLHNLKSVDLRVPRGRLTVLTGVSGAGKTSLMTGTLAVAARDAAGQKATKEERATWKSTKNLNTVRAVYQVDQSPIGKTPRSTPATYVGLFDEIRKLFAMSADAKRLGFDAGRFSFNTSSGNCEACKGTGMEKQEMDFLPPCSIPCETCRGSRYNSRTLQVRYKGKNIAEVLDMSMEEAAEFFDSQPRLAEPLRLLCETGLSYLTLGQASNTLSGGEAQRIKLVSELIKGRRAAIQAVKKGRELPQDLYLIEEPTIGLHPKDVRLLIDVLQRLVELGNTVVVIEHNLELVAEADYVIDVGPGAGSEGGTIVAEGSVKAVARSRKSVTAPFLRQELEG